ncbi:hypothetical protein [Mycoplasmopsis alligatoris]|uniref:Uncharacterized protein n=1 Tax=Mycoplasmopsis alligatoris A21JP2 TaxID=747682 RepID=D4XWM1_9BACT|nr:hypothetical protein [Mycoplasmopsis alligatoris]EFF41170.1 conserved hypothetical protein [Mycoplasmopsis alligatoris A21JP2]
MEKIINILEKRISKDKILLRIYSFLDKFMGAAITILNLVIIGIACYALHILTGIIKELNDTSWYKNVSLLLILVLTILIIFQFFLTIFLEIYKRNMKDTRYLRIKNSIENLYIKYSYGYMSEKEMKKCVNNLYKKLNKKEKYEIMAVIKSHLRNEK